jgi:hypothetical protein
MTKRFPILLFAIAALLFVYPASAHHSSAGFNIQHPITIKGKVTSFDWANPHAFIYLNVKNKSGGIDEWRVEANSPNMLSRAGWNREIIKPGDEITVMGGAANNGALVMRLDNIVLASGQKLDGQGFVYGH